MAFGPGTLVYIARRLAQAVPIVLGIVVLNFLLLQLAPGDAATVLAGEAGGAPPEYVALLRERFGLDQPMHVQLCAVREERADARSRLLVPERHAGHGADTRRGLVRRCC